MEGSSSVSVTKTPKKRPIEDVSGWIECCKSSAKNIKLTEIEGPEKLSSCLITHELLHKVDKDHPEVLRYLHFAVNYFNGRLKEEYPHEERSVTLDEVLEASHEFDYIKGKGLYVFKVVATDHLGNKVEYLVGVKRHNAKPAIVGVKTRNAKPAIVALLLFYPLVGSTDAVVKVLMPSASHHGAY